MPGIELPPMTTADPRWRAAVDHAAANCVVCHPARHPLGPTPPATRSHETHVGVRFGDVGPKWLITLDGHDCTDYTVEADAVAGWVIAHVPAPALPHPAPPGKRVSVLSHGDHAILAVLDGVVKVTRAPAGGRLIRPRPAR